MVLGRKWAALWSVPLQESVRPPPAFLQEQTPIFTPVLHCHFVQRASFRTILPPAFQNQPFEIQGVEVIVHLFLELLSFVETFMSRKDHPVTWPQRDLKRRDVFPPEFKQNKFCTYMGYVLKSTVPLFSSFAVWAFAVNFSWKFFHQCEITFWKGHSLRMRMLQMNLWGCVWQSHSF